MRDITNKSIKLNRQLDKLLIEAKKKDLLVKIGWGRDQDCERRVGGHHVVDGRRVVAVQRRVWRDAQRRHGFSCCSRSST